MSVEDSNPETGPSTAADEPAVDQSTGSSGASDGGDGSNDSGGRPLGVTAAVERGPAELSDEGEPVRDTPHASLEDAEPARSTDDL